MSTEKIKRKRGQVSFLGRGTGPASNGGRVEWTYAKGWVLGWITFDVYATYKDNAFGNSVPYIRLHSGWSEQEVAQQIIREVTTGYFSHHFNAHTMLQGADDFSGVESFVKWKDYVIAEWAGTVSTGARLTLEAYSMGFAGTDLILTAQDIEDEGISWWHGLELIQLVPVLGKLRSLNIILRNDAAEEIVRISTRRNGATHVKYPKALVGSLDEFYDSAQVVPTNRSTVHVTTDIAGEISSNACGPGAIHMHLGDYGAPGTLWFQHMPVPNSAGVISMDQIEAFFDTTFRNVTGPRWKHLKNAQSSQMDLGELLVAVQSHPLIARIKTKDGTGHAVIVDTVDFVEGSTEAWVTIRDPALGSALQVSVDEFQTMLEAVNSVTGLTQKGLSDVITWPKHADFGHYDDLVRQGLDVIGTPPGQPALLP